MSTNQYQYAGTISSGTLRGVDLAPVFVDQLERMGADVADFRPRVSTLLATGDENADEDLIGELIDALDQAAPEGYTFGPHEGDGADFGFWPIDADD